ncbi:hypothetical protein Agabi119p4_11651 [Agaricus bisporus var. burnettii]|uniref:PIH1 N-terminal domain-containing protein n=1 Tax=Agaricus bisporus var. burnettii TaxID=192524 RepID=A0A8H7EV76_AGABI|nr:hypothetical protein Agabi119p4_11651 [Agaricus bisporus var. burnettii]
MATVPLDLAPTPGFCVKSAAGPGSQKVFVNICYDKNVPPPPPADEATIKRAMNIHQDDDDDDGNYYVPVVVSQPRQDRDKAGNLALVIDCVYNSTLRSRTLREPDFKIFLVDYLALDSRLGDSIIRSPSWQFCVTPLRIVAQIPRRPDRLSGFPYIPSTPFYSIHFLSVPTHVMIFRAHRLILFSSIELALQRIEAQTSLVLSRQIGTPNIVAKGKLEPRRVWVPAWIAAGKYGPEDDKMEDDKRKGSGLELIEEIEPSRTLKKGEENSVSGAAPKLKGILKNSSGDKTDGSGAKNASIGITGTQPLPRGVVNTPQRPMWTWKKEAEGQILIMVVVPQETPHEAIRSSTLDVEPRRLILHIPGSAKTPTLDLDVDLNKSDAEIVASAPENTAAIGIYGMSEGGDLKEPDNTLLLKRQRKFEVDMASAEWKVAEGLLVISV